MSLPELARGLLPVSEGAETVTVSGFAIGLTDYAIVALPNWPTGLWELSASDSSFTLGCTVPAPTDATVRWAVLAPAEVSVEEAAGGGAPSAREPGRMALVGAAALPALQVRGRLTVRAPQRLRVAGRVVLGRLMLRAALEHRSRWDESAEEALRPAGPDDEAALPPPDEGWSDR